MTGLELLDLHRVKSAQELGEWSHFLRCTRQFFWDRGFIEVTTPVLVNASTLDAGIDTLGVVNSKNIPLGELHTSPEFGMKALLSHASEKIFQITPCFRDDPHGEWHRVEFYMLEFYVPGMLLPEAMHFTWEFFKGVAHLPSPCVFYSWESFCKEILHVSEGAVLPEDDPDYLDRFSQFFLEHVDPILAQQETPVVLYDFPAPLSSLAQVSGTPPRAHRFEFYMRGIELCNGFLELVNVEEMMPRISLQNKWRSRSQKKNHPPPTLLLDAMNRGLPQPLSGVAVGLQRLFTWAQKFSSPSIADSPHSQ